MNGHMALVVDQQGAALELGTHGTVVLRYADGRCERVGFKALNAIVLHGDVKLSTKLLRLISKYNIAFAALSAREDTEATGFVQLPERQAAMRHRQHLAYANPDLRLALARTVVERKLRSMADIARRGAPGRGNSFLPAMYAAAEARNLTGLMGIEGAASAVHFGLLEKAYATDGAFAFDGRSRRPPQDAPNALMSLSYTLAQATAVQLVLHAGLDAQFGFLHSLHRDRQSLALDLIEPARAPMDDWVHDLLVRRRFIAAEMFAKSANGPAWLSKGGRRVFYPLWFREGVRIALPPMRALLAELLRTLRRMPLSPATPDSVGAPSASSSP